MLPAGLGCGATGFTTRSDIGPSLGVPDRSIGGVPDRSIVGVPDRSIVVVGRGRGEGDEDDKFDELEFEGNDDLEELFANSEYDDTDVIHKNMDDDSRRKDMNMNMNMKMREARLKEEIEKYPKITEQYLKRKLSTPEYADADKVKEAHVSRRDEEIDMFLAFNPKRDYSKKKKMKNNNKSPYPWKSAVDGKEYSMNAGSAWLLTLYPPASGQFIVAAAHAATLQIIADFREAEQKGRLRLAEQKGRLRL